MDEVKVFTAYHMFEEIKEEVPDDLKDKIEFDNVHFHVSTIAMLKTMEVLASINDASESKEQFRKTLSHIGNVAKTQMMEMAMAGKVTSCVNTSDLIKPKSTTQH